MKHRPRYQRFWSDQFQPAAWHFPRQKTNTRLRIFHRLVAAPIIFPFLLCGCPTKNGLPQKGFPCFARVTEQLSLGPALESLQGESSLLHSRKSPKTDTKGKQGLSHAQNIRACRRFRRQTTEPAHPGRGAFSGPPPPTQLPRVSTVDGLGEFELALEAWQGHTFCWSCKLVVWISLVVWW